jgi:excisionase family DNA binding protein
MEKNDLEILIQDVVKSTLNRADLERSVQEGFLDINEAANYLKIARQTLYGFTSQRLIPFIKKGKRIYFRKTDLENWLLSGRKATKSEIESSEFSDFRKMDKTILDSQNRRGSK